MIRSIRRFAAVAFVAAAATVPAQAQYSFVNSAAGIGGNALLNWAQLGGPYTSVANNTSGLTVTNSSLTAAISQAGGPFERRDQGPSWGGNFATGATLLWTRGDNGPLTIMFSNAVSAVGASYQRDTYGAFQGTVEALDKNKNVLASFIFNGVSNAGGGNLAVFAGIASSMQDIWGVRFRGANGDSNNFAISNVAVNLNAQVVPEPSTYALMGTGLLALGGMARRRRITV